MDDPAPANNQSDAAPPPSDAPMGSTGKQEAAKLTHREKHDPQSNHNPSYQSAWRRWQEHTLAERVMAYFTGVVAICAALQVWILIGGSGQTDQLITAAKINACAAQKIAAASERNAKAAESFSTSAGHINDGIGKAVGNLGAQARATQQSAEAAKGANDIASASIRPWIKITDVGLPQGAGPMETLMFHAPVTGEPSPPDLQIKISMMNIGHSPAQDVEFFTDFFFAKLSTDKWYTMINSEQQNFCASTAERRAIVTTQFLFPSDRSDYPFAVGGIVNEGDITKKPGDDTPYITSELILCVNYRGAKGTAYQTQARFWLAEDHDVSIPFGRDVQADHLQLIREPSADHAY